MKRFRRILFHSDAKEDEMCALVKAIDLARRNAARLTVAGVIPDLPLEDIPASALSGLEQQAMDEARRRLTLFLAPLRTGGVDLDIKVLKGTPFIELIREVLRNKHDLVMMAAEGRLRDTLFGSTSMRMMRKCPCPVWVIKPGQHVRFERVLAAVDPFPSDPARDAINGTIMELASSLARLEDSDLHIVHVCNTSELEALPGAGAALAVREMEAKHKRLFEDLIGRLDLGGLRCRSHMIRGEAVSAISSLAEKEKVDLIVMGTLVKTGITGFLMGHTAEGVLRHVQCSVLTVKADGFVSPVQADNT